MNREHTKRFKPKYTDIGETGVYQIITIVMYKCFGFGSIKVAYIMYLNIGSMGMNEPYIE